MEEEGDEVRGAHHIAKRARKNKGSVAVFDDAARTEYLTGFRKRKNKRRKIAEAQNQVKERQKRLLDRKERRMALNAARGEQLEGETEEEAMPETEETETKDDDSLRISETTTYDDGNNTIVVTTRSLEPDKEPDGVQHSRHRGTSLGKRNATPLGSTQPKKTKSVNKKQKVVSQKRTKKLTRRERSVPKNQRSKKGGRRK